MRKLQVKYLYLLALATTFLSSCELVKGIFKAGFYSAIFIVIVVIVLIVWLLSSFRRR